MTDVARDAATGTPYRRVQSKERLLHEGPLLEALSALKCAFALSADELDRRLEKGLAEADRRGSGFFVSGFAARRALGTSLIMYIDPRRIEHRLEHRVAEGDRVYLIRDRCLGAGDWTPLLTLVRSSSTYREVRQIVEADFDYRRTRAYQSALERSRGAKPVRRNFVALRSPDRVETYFRQTTELCRSIQEVGLRRRAEHGVSLSAKPKGWSVRLPWVELGEVDVGVAIGSRGEIYRFASGKHRTAAAQALGLSIMPVEVRMVHSDWLARRMSEGDSSPVEALLGGIRGLDMAAR